MRTSWTSSEMSEKLQEIAEAWGIPLDELLHALVEENSDDCSGKSG